MPGKSRAPVTQSPASPRSASPAVSSATATGSASQTSASLTGGGLLDALSSAKSALYDVRLGMEGRQEGVLEDGHDISNADVVFEQLARGAYIPQPAAKLAGWGYQEASRIDDADSGFAAVLYVPTEEARSGKTPAAQAMRAIHGGPVPPVVAFRGTDNKKGVQDDVNKAGVGAYQFSANEANIQGMLKAAGGKAVVTGHSLGGTLAQRAAVGFPGSVSRVVTYQAPGIGKEDAERLKAHNASAAPADRVASTHHRVDGDVVHMAGEALTEGEVFTHTSVGIGNPLDHKALPLARLSAARGNLVPGVNDGDFRTQRDTLVSIERTTTDQEKSGVMPGISEAVRKGVGGLVDDPKMEKYARLWDSVKEMATSGAFSLKYVQGVIADNPELTAEQKVRMREQAAGLYRGPTK